jgi:dihydroxyacetone kinase
VFVHKVAGAAAERGYELSQVKAVAEKAIANVKSIGFALTSCTVPAKGTPTFELAEDEMEYGVGIHGEPGIRREKLVTADELSERMVTSLLEELKVNEESREVAVLINGFGGTPVQELYLLNNSVSRELYKRDIKVVRTLVGNYMTSIDMAGASVSIMKIDDELKELLSDVCDTPALKINGDLPSISYEEIAEENKENKTVSYTVETNKEYALIEDDKITLRNIIFVVDQMSESIIRNEVPFCELDSYAGDGDFGMSVAKGFKQLKSEWNEIISNKVNDIGSFLEACSLVIMEHCGGASGPIWGSAFRAAGKNAGTKVHLTTEEFADMMQAAVKGIQATGERSFGRGAVVGDKTLIDALVPCADSWKASAKAGDNIKDALAKAAEAAVKGAKATEDIVARMGRAGTVGDRSLGHPDAGAYALGIIFTEIAQVMRRM